MFSLKTNTDSCKRGKIQQIHDIQGSKTSKKADQKGFHSQFILEFTRIQHNALSVAPAFWNGYKFFLSIW